jgi:hypothetical protein
MWGLMKRSYILHILITIILLGDGSAATKVFAADDKYVITGQVVNSSNANRYVAELEKYAKYTKVVSGGRYGGSQVSIRIGCNGFYENVPDSMGTIGLYVVAVYKNEVLLKYHYNTYFDNGASEGFARDIKKLPKGTFVVIAAKEEPTRLFDKRGQEALYKIGAQKGLLGQEYRTSYLCMGVKGLERGKAIEKVGKEQLSYIGPDSDKLIKFTFPEKPKPKIVFKHGKIQRMMVSQTEVLYYIPKYFDPNTAEYLFGIHGAGGSGGAWTIIDEFRNISDIKNFVLIAPRFDGIYNATFAEMDRKAREKGKFDFPLLKDFYLSMYQLLLNNRNPHRSDLKLIEIFDVFNEQLMKRPKFNLYGVSGGGQFVARFAVFHPELLDKVVAAAAGSYAFPNRNKDYPYGLNMDNLEKYFGAHINPAGIRLSSEEIDQKLNNMLDLDMHVIVGEHDTVAGSTWQGKDTTEKCYNFYLAMLEEDKKLKERGIRSSDKECKLKYYMMKGVGHDAHAAAAKAIELAFPITKKKTKGQVLHIDFNRNYKDRSEHRNIVTSEKPPKIRHGKATFVPGARQFLRSNMHRSADLLGCTELTIKIRLRMNKNPKRHPYTRVIQTCDSQWSGCAIGIKETNIIWACIHTTSSKSTVVVYRRIGVSPRLYSKIRIDDGKWHDVLLTYTGSEVMLFIDGILQESTAWDGALVHCDNINIGYVASNGFYFDGEIDDIEILGSSMLP